MTDRDAIWAVGTMSGTSLDGVDAACLRTDGHEIFEFGRTGYRAYPPQERAELRAVLGRWPGAGLERAGDLVHRAHLEVLRPFRADLVGFHGQTLAHDPAGARTHQLGDGDLLARHLKCPVAWDFRTADMQNGGQGAPLAPFFHFACAKWVGVRRPVAILNLGGVGNLTWIDPTAAGPEEPGALWAFDTGPANAPIDDLVMSRTGARYDAGGQLASFGTVQQTWVETFMADPFFAGAPPKSLDRNDFASYFSALDAFGVEDAAATLTAAIGASVAQGLSHVPPVAQIWVTGGGRHNPAIMDAIRAYSGVTAQSIDAVGLDGDMLEAQAFAFLAVRVQRGLALSAPGTTGARAPIVGGRLSYP